MHIYLLFVLVRDHCVWQCWSRPILS